MNKIIVAVTMAAVCTGMYALAEPRVVQEASGYNSWPMIQAIGEKLVCVYSRGTSHTIAEDARAVYARTSADNGKTWTPETVVASTSGYGEVAVGKGLDSDGAMFLWVRRMNGSECVQDLYRTTDGVTFLLVATPKLAVAPVQITDIFSVPTVGLMALWFAGSYGDDGPSHSWGTLTSRDNGATWAQSTIESELTKPQWPTEPAAVYLGNVGDLQQWREAANLLRLLGHPVRLALLEELAKAPKCVTDIQDLLEVSSDLVQMVKDLIADGVTVKVCGTCQARCGIRKGEPYYEGAQKSTMAELSQWVRESEQVLTF